MATKEKYTGAEDQAAPVMEVPRKGMYQYATEFMKVAELLENGEWSEEIEAILSQVEAGGDAKFESCYYACKNLVMASDLIKAKMECFQAEIERLSGVEKSIQSNIEQIQNTMHAYMKVKKIDKYKKGGVDVILRKGSDFIYIESSVPTDFIKMKIERSVFLIDYNTWAANNPEWAALEKRASTINSSIDKAGFKSWVKANAAYAEKELGAYFEETRKLTMK